MISYCQPIEHFIAVLLGGLFEDFQVLENLGVDLDLIVEPDGIFTQEVEDDRGRWLERDVLVL